MADRVILVCTLLLAGVYFYATERLPTLEIGDPLGPKAFPRLLTIGLLITALVLLVEILRARKERAPVAKAPAVDYRTYLVVGGATLWTVVYFFFFETLGYVIATSAYLFALMAYFNRGKWVANTLTAVLFSVGSYYMFQVLGVSLARGVLTF